ncbi:MAG: esterase [Thiobacillaceae bacterium]
MVDQIRQGIELLPQPPPVKQLFILMHGVGGLPSDLAALADKLREAFPNAALLLTEGSCPFDGGGSGRQWFSTADMTEANRASRVAAAMPALHALVNEAQNRFNVLPPDTALVGFSQGAIMALEFTSVYDGMVGRVVAFSGRYARLPETAPALTTIHLLHGKEDHVIPVAHAYAGYERISTLQGDATLDIASLVGHELHPALRDRAINRLQTCIPLRTWKRALGG